MTIEENRLNSRVQHLKPAAPLSQINKLYTVGLVRCQHVFITNLCNYHPWHSKLLKVGQSAHGMGSKQPIAFIPRQREDKNVWYVLLSPRRINNTHTTYLNGFRGSCEIHPPLQPRLQNAQSAWDKWPALARWWWLADLQPSRRHSVWCC